MNKNSTKLLILGFFLMGNFSFSQLFKTGFSTELKSDASPLSANLSFTTWASLNDSNSTVTLLSSDGNTATEYLGSDITNPNGTTITASGNGCARIVQSATTTGGLKSQMKNGVHPYGRQVTVGFWAKAESLDANNDQNKMQVRVRINDANSGSSSQAYSNWTDVTVAEGWKYVTVNVGSKLDGDTSDNSAISAIVPGTRPAYAASYSSSTRGFRSQIVIQTAGVVSSNDYRGTMLIDDITVTGLSVEFNNTGTAPTVKGKFSSSHIPTQYESLIYPEHSYIDGTTDNGNFYINVDENSDYGGGTNGNGLYEVYGLYITNTASPSTKRIQIAPSTNANEGVNSLRVCGDLEISDGAGLYIQKGSEVIVLGNFVDNNDANDGNVHLQSDKDQYASLKVSGTASGNFIKYEMWFNGATSNTGSTWDLKGSPLSSGSVTGSNFYNNDSNYAVESFNNTNGTYTTNNTSGNIDLVDGMGYATASSTQNGGTVEIIGAYNATTNNQVSITNNVTTAGDKKQFNLVSNPYSSYVAINDAAKNGSDATGNILRRNALASGQDVLGHVDEEIAVFGWTGSGWNTITNASSATFLAPGQGFFVSMDGDGDGNGGSAGSGDFDIMESMQTTIRGMSSIQLQGFALDNVDENRAELFLNLNFEGLNKKTEIYFIEDVTDNIDPGYDGALFGLSDMSNNLYTRTVQNDTGKNLAVQALNYLEMSNKIIPLGVHAQAGTEATISISHNTTPTEIYVYLEDAQEGTFTNLREMNYVITPDSDLEGVGRFFVHTTADTMSNEQVTSSYLNVFKLFNNNFITVEGLATQSNSANLKLYNLLGKEMLSIILDNNTNIHRISTEGLAMGIYVIKLETGTDLLTKKIIIK
jgi:hypothetical protein